MLKSRRGLLKAVKGVLNVNLIFQISKFGLKSQVASIDGRNCYQIANLTNCYLKGQICAYTLG